MIDIPDQLPPPPPARWLWDLLQTPQLTRYRRVNKRFRVVALIAYSGLCGTPGMICDTDGAIAHAIGLDEDLDQLHALFDEMIAKRDLRAIEIDLGDGPVRRYEFSRRLVPMYQGDPRMLDAWDVPAPVMTRAETAHPLEVEGEQRKKGGNTKWTISDVSPAEKMAFSRFCQAERAQAEREGRRAPVLSRDKWVLEYRAGRLQNSEQADTVTFEMSKNGQTKSNKSNSDSPDSPLPSSRVDDVDNVTSDSGLESNTENQQQQQGAKVTDPKVTQKEVSDYFKSEGLWADAADAASAWCSLEDARVYVFWARHEVSKKGGQFGAFLNFLLEEPNRPIEPGMRNLYQAAVIAERTRQQEQLAQKRDAETVEACHATFALMQEAAREHLCKEVAGVVASGRGSELYRAFLHARRNDPRKKPNPGLQQMLDAEIVRRIADEKQLPPLVTAVSIPPLWVMPANWDGFRPTPDKL